MILIVFINFNFKIYLTIKIPLFYQQQGEQRNKSTNGKNKFFYCVVFLVVDVHLHKVCPYFSLPLFYIHLILEYF